MSARGEIYKKVFFNVRDADNCVTWGSMYQSVLTPHPFCSNVMNTVTYNLFQELERHFHQELLRPLLRDLGDG